MNHSLINFLCLSLPLLIAGFVLPLFKIKESVLKLMPSFSAAFLFSLCCLHLLPELFEQNEYAKLSGLFILIGFILQILLEFISSGLEHGHFHLHTNHSHNHPPELGMIIGLFLHSFLEGISLGIPNENYDYKLAFGITLHNLPIMLAFSLFLASHSEKKFYLIYIILFSLMPFFGSISHRAISFLFSDYFIVFSRCSAGLVIGIFLHIATVILFENSDNHKYNLNKLISIIIAFILTWVML